MSQFSNYWKIITPASRKQLYTTISTDAFDPRTTDMSSMTAVTWYSQVMRGPGSRMGSYKQYDAMDADIDIARSLDIIAEEMSGKDEKTKLPFMIEYQKEDNQDVSDTTAITLRQAVRQWSEMQDMRRRLFGISRALIKYGDCFFKKTSDTKKWTWVDPLLVYGIEIDQHGNKLNYYLKKPGMASTTSGAGGFGVHGQGVNASGGRGEEMDVIPAAAMIHFTMSDEMGDSAPFGASVLRPIFRVYRQLSMIEDAVIIYRIVRAPERRVFYVDVGNMPAQRVKTYLEQVKNEIRQKRVPGMSNNGQKDVVDGQYDPTSIQEDMFFPVTANGRGSRVETLPGGTEDFGTNLLKYFQEKVFRGLRIPTSYMGGTEGQGAQYNDGKVGIAYIEELRFAKFIMRLQERINDVLDQEFKIYMKVCGLKIDDEIFAIRLPDPANFALYRQAALDADLISSFNNIEQTKYLSKRFILKRYLGLSDDEIQMNEAMLKEERGILENSNIPSMQQLYDPSVYENREQLTVEQPGAGLPGEDQLAGGLGGEDDIGGCATVPHRDHAPVAPRMLRARPGPSTAPRHQHGVHLDVEAHQRRLRQGPHRRRVGDIGRIDGVELLGIGRVLQKHAHAHGVLQGQTGGLGCRLEVVQGHARLEGERLVAVPNVLAVARRLSGQEHEPASLHRDAVGARRQGRTLAAEGPPDLGGIQTLRHGSAR